MVATLLIPRARVEPRSFAIRNLLHSFRTSGWHRRNGL